MHSSKQTTRKNHNHTLLIKSHILYHHCTSCHSSGASSSSILLHIGSTVTVISSCLVLIPLCLGNQTCLVTRFSFPYDYPAQETVDIPSSVKLSAFSVVCLCHLDIQGVNGTYYMSFSPSLSLKHTQLCLMVHGCGMDIMYVSNCYLILTVSLNSRRWQFSSI